jgi:C4-dicarboxylate-specific signal transduction histidine kinase
MLRAWQQGDSVSEYFSDLSRAQTAAGIFQVKLTQTESLDHPDTFKKAQEVYQQIDTRAHDLLERERSDELKALISDLLIGSLLAPLLLYLMTQVAQRRIRDRYEHVLQESISREQYVAELKNRADMALSSAKMAIWDWDVVKNQLIWDQRMYEVYGVSPQKFTGAYEAWANSVHPEDIERAGQELKDAMIGKSHFNTQFRVVREDGSIGHVRGVGHVTRNADGVAIRVTGLNWDVTHEVEVEQEMKVSHTRQLAASKMASLGEMAGGIAHEINNPLTVIAGKASLLKRQVMNTGTLDPKTAVEALQKIEVFVTRIAKIVKGLRNFSRDASHDPMEIFTIQAVIDDSLALCQERFKSHQVLLNYQQHADPIWIKGQAVQLSQIIVNLMSNAYDAVMANRETSTPSVAIQLMKEGQTAVIRVQDSGKGVPIGIEQKIMQPFFTTKEAGKGTGLGLSISQNIAREHQGSLTLNRAISNSCFELVLPIHEQEKLKQEAS